MRNTAMKMRPLFTRFWRTAAGGRFTTAACGVRSIGGDRFGEQSREKTHFEGDIAVGEYRAVSALLFERKRGQKTLVGKFL